MADLSSAAQAILKAAYKATRNPKWQTNFYTSYAAAVLRAAADQVVPENPCGHDCCITQCEQIRAELLAIAAELKAHD